MTLDLTELKKRFQPQSALALTLEPERMALSVVRRDDASEPMKSVSICIGADEILKAPEKAGAELASALEGAGIHERRCVVNIPPGWALSASADLPEVSLDDLRGYFELRAEREFSIPVADLRLAHCPYRLPDGTLRATLAAVPAKRLEAVGKMLSAAKCRAVSISLALGGCFADPQPVMHFLTSAGHADVVVSTGRGIALLRSLAGPGGTNETPLDSTAFCREIRITLGRLPEPLRRALRTARFSGGLASELERITAEYLQRMGIESRPGTQPQPEKAGAVESAKRYLRKEPVAFEFVVTEPSRWPAKLQWFNTRRGRQISAAAVGAVLLPLLVFTIRSKMESSLQTEWDGMKNSVAELDLIQQKIRQFRPWFDHTPDNLQVLESFIAAFPAQADIWTKSVQVGVGHKVTCAGFARNQPALMAFLDRLRARPDFSAVQVQQLRGQNPIQFSLTCKWEARHDK